ncbi:MAG: group II intron reverse transcriptase/maturase [Syntrophorhabdales bacterium]|jgi:group II intron reverse transcriptase/maturase
MSSQTVSTKLQWIAERAVRDPKRVFTSLAHLIDIDFLKEAYHRTRKNAAPGVDGVTAEEYGKNLDENLRNLHERLRTGRYKAPPAKRVWLDKDDGGKRPIGMAGFEDKIAQRAVAMILGAVYEQDFEDFSHGFREGHSQHQALHELREKCREIGVAWIVDADVAKFFDSLDWNLLLKIIKRRVNDGALLRLIGKWLNAGVMEGLTLIHPEKGTPQGGVISPVLSNIFLHHVLDRWYVRDVRPRLQGRSFLIRFADDFLIGCEREDDARRVLAALPKRFNLFKLAIHPEKTALIRFRKPSSVKKTDNENGTFEFLGFTHFWAKARQGFWVIKRQTAKKRLSRAMTSLWQWCRDHRHDSLSEQYRMLCLKLRGHYQYYGVRTNYRMLVAVMRQVEKAWRYWLSRRSSKGYIGWEDFERLRRVFPLPKPRIYHAI